MLLKPFHIFRVLMAPINLVSTILHNIFKYGQLTHCMRNTVNMKVMFRMMIIVRTNTCLWMLSWSICFVKCIFLITSRSSITWWTEKSIESKLDCYTYTYVSVAIVHKKHNCLFRNTFYNRIRSKKVIWLHSCIK